MTCPHCPHPDHGQSKCRLLLVEEIHDTIGFFAPPSGEIISLPKGFCSCRGNGDFYR